MYLLIDANVRSGYNIFKVIKNEFIGSVFMVELIINQALKMHRKIEIIYMCDKGITKRIIKPIKLENNTLEAYCFAKNSIRKFKLEGILSAGYVINKKAG
ncbi:MAG: hypothetical protein A2Y23_02355 [Clostridiales bacterium GWB2_37_7]|nr:MAG: hypothetical protein A2Y23_02355 [Clostridiales bacterium GWB2_37_7]